LPLLSLCTVNTVTHSYDTSAVLPLLLLVRYRQNPGRRFQVSTIFLLFFMCKILYSIFWVEGTFQARALKLFFIRFRPNFLTIPTSFFICQPHNRTYIFLCSGKIIKEIARTQIIRFEKQCESTSDILHFAVNNFTVT
jgi:hypothetical protein